jgi:hypothetical protein
LSQLQAFAIALVASLQFRASTSSLCMLLCDSLWLHPHVLQVAGLRFFHTSGVYSSLAVLNPDGSVSPIKPDAKYTIVATDYMLQGGDGFGMFKGAEVLLPAGAPYAQVFIEDLQLFPQGVGGVAGFTICTFPSCSQGNLRQTWWEVHSVLNERCTMRGDAYGQPCFVAFGDTRS